MTEPKIRVLVVEDHTVVRKGLCALLSSERYGCEVVGEAADGVQAVAKAEALAPDVILMDLLMPRKGGIEATQEICHKNAGARVLILTSFDDQARVTMALKVGALGYVLKDASPDELVHAIRSVYLGQITVPAALGRAVLAPQTGPVLPEPAELTERELDVLRALARGLSDREIAAALSISVATVRSHVRSILSKLNFSSRTQAALYAVEIGLSKPGRS